MLEGLLEHEGGLFDRLGGRAEDPLSDRRLDAGLQHDNAGLDRL